MKIELKTSQFIGLTEKEATELAVKEGYSVRVIKRDTVQYMVTRDLRMNRVNFTILFGKVSEAYFG